jgi:wyosine [tRNA(Phe)-imidazoG37] synthetase (radical SAM superfamily)
MIEEKQFFCERPFTFIEVRNDGNIYPCCIGWTEYPFGSWEIESFNDVWNGVRAKEFRRSILDGSYRFCKLKRCIRYGDKSSFYTQDEIRNRFKETCSPPEIIDFCHEKVCNVRCVMCRDEHIHSNEAETERLNEKIGNFFLPMMANIRCVTINGEGEALASAHCRKLIKTIAENYPSVKFNLRSNGVLVDKNNFESLGIIDKVQDVIISLHAATKKTYNKIVLNSDFRRIIKNIEWLCSMKKTGKINNIYLIAVISFLNYREMIPFIKLAQRYNAMVTFLEYVKWDTKMGQHYDKMAVFKEWHPQYNKYVRISNKIMNNGNLRNSVSSISPLLFNLKLISTGEWLRYRIKEMTNRLKKSKAGRRFREVYNYFKRGK